MLMQNDPFRDFDRFFKAVGARSDAHTGVPMDAYRRGSDVWVHLDLPGVPADAVDVSVERSVLTVTAERNFQREEGDQTYMIERPVGAFRRQVHLGENLDVDGIEADFADGVLTLRIPVSEQAKAKKIEISTKAPALEVETAPAS